MTRFSSVHFEDLSGPRLQLALELIASGHEASFRDVGFALVDGVLQVRAPSPWVPENLTDSRAWSEIERAKAVLGELGKSPAFAAVISDHPVRFSVTHDGGMSSVELCWLENGRRSGVRRAAQRRSNPLAGGLTWLCSGLAALDSLGPLALPARLAVELTTVRLPLWRLR